ncbi:MAG: hypothetical protein H0X16_10260 [Chloroflexi bacterium]|nr:hypothetical protein [Chloroflexota bacterium]
MSGAAVGGVIGGPPGAIAGAALGTVRGVVAKELIEGAIDEGGGSPGQPADSAPTGEPNGPAARRDRQLG